MGKSKICIVEDDAFYAKMIRHRLSMDPDLDVNVYHDAESFLADLSENPQVVTLDHSLPDMSGLELLKKVRREKPNIQFIVLSAQEDITTAVELFQNGVYDYIVKDASAMDKLWHLVHKALERSTLHEEVRVLEEEVANKYNFQETIRGSSAPMQKVFGLLEKTAKTNITVTVTGETGTGKELVAKAIHFNSLTNQEAICCCQCGCYSEGVD
jgi:two-component system, NtrC family, response regulator AtoC